MSGWDWRKGVAGVIGGDAATNRGGALIRGLGLFAGVLQCVEKTGPGRSLSMLGAMMFPGEDAALEDMRVPPIQLEHLPEVFLCT